jgi:hypothetical protein
MYCGNDGTEYLHTVRLKNEKPFTVVIITIHFQNLPDMREETM